MDGRRRAATAMIVVVMVVVVLVLPSLSNAILSCKEGFSSRTNSTFISPKCYKKQWWRAVEQNKVPGMCLPNLQMSTPGQNNVTCRELRTRREAHHAKAHIRDKKTLCSEFPAVPAHMVLAKSANGFLGTCREGYGFSSSFIQSLSIQCQSGMWIKNHSHPCRPQCINQCLNGGTCIDVETCLCPPGTAGLTCGTLVWGTCQTTVKWQNVIVKAIVQGLLLRCPRGYKLLQYKPYEHWLLQCKASGFEEPPGVTWDQDHPCLPVCEPPCHDGATCVAPGKCTCGDGTACADCETRQHCTLPVVLHGAAYRLAPQLSRVSCFGERLPAARSRSLLLRCSKDHWVTASGKTVAGHQMTCSFFCNRECQNGGRCVGLNKCLCRGGFEGPFCGYPMCGSTSLRVLHASYSLSRRSSAEMVFGTVRCNDEYRMASGEQETSFQCLDGKWYFSGDMSGHKFVECHPLCSPPCVNRGTCIAPGHCLCSGGFTGKYCEMRPTTTTDGMRCVFPFSNGHKIYSSCVIADDDIPWCPTQVNLDRQPVAWQMCNTTNNLEQVVGTISGSTCAFPFKWNGTTWWKCAPDEKMRYWCAIHVTTNGHILQADFCWLDHGLSYTQPECQPSTGCPLPSILGNSRVEISFPLYPWAATNTITSTTTPATKPITTMTNEVPTLVIPQIPGMAPLAPVPPLFPFPPHIAPPPSPPNPSLIFPQPQPIPPMPFVPPPPPPMPPPILVLQQPMLPPMPQPVSVFMPPSLQPQPVIQLAPIVPLQQPLPRPPHPLSPSLSPASPLPPLPKAPPQPPPPQPPPLPSLPPAPPLPSLPPAPPLPSLPPAPPLPPALELVEQQQLLLRPPPQSMQAPAPRPLRLLSQPLQLSTPKSTQPTSPSQSLQPSPPLPPRYVSKIPSFHQESVLSEPPPPPPPTVRLPSRLTQRSHPERPTEPTAQYPDSHDPDEPVPPPTQPSRFSARPTPSPSQPTRQERPQQPRRPTSRLDQSKSRRRPKPTEPPIRPTVHKQRRRRPRPTELHASKRHKSRGTHPLKPISRPQRPQ